MTSEGEETVNNNSSLEIRDQLTSDYVTGVKERAVLKDELKETTKELNHVKGKNYDLLKKIEKIEKENKELSKQQLDKKGKKKKPAKRKVPRSKKSSNKDEKENEKVDPFEDTDTLYAEVAKKFPELPLSTVLVAQQKFTEADINNDGIVDAIELEKMLDTASMLFTKEDIKDILIKIDVDGSNTLDFFECLKVCDLLRNNRKTGLPQTIHNQKSSLCSIQ